MAAETEGKDVIFDTGRDDVLIKKRRRKKEAVSLGLRAERDTEEAVR